MEIKLRNSRTSRLQESTPWYTRIRWYPFHLLITIPILGFIAARYTPLVTKTVGLAICYFNVANFCVTAGYHRLWSHRSYTASLPLRLLLALFGAGAMQGSVKWWVRGHRAHHRYTDTEQDPYNINRGFLHAHLLWMIVKPTGDKPQTYPKVDMADVQRDPVVAWQHRYYVPLAVLMGWIAPSLLAGCAWGDYLGGFVYAGVLRMFCNHQVTFCINSVAHYWGRDTYDDRLSPRDNWLLVPLTLGEGYHNFHHEFPADYRNGVEWYHFDVTKWGIYLCAVLGLASDLHRCPRNDIDKGRLAQQAKRVVEQQAQLQWGTPIHELPEMSWMELKRQVEGEGRPLLVIEGVVYDVAGLVGQHPGGDKVLRAYRARDATAAFNGGVYRHSNAARNRMELFRYAVLEEQE